MCSCYLRFLSHKGLNISWVTESKAWNIVKKTQIVSSSCGRTDIVKKAERSVVDIETNGLYGNFHLRIDNSTLNVKFSYYCSAAGKKAEILWELLRHFFIVEQEALSSI